MYRSDKTHVSDTLQLEYDDRVLQLDISWWLGGYKLRYEPAWRYGKCYKNVSTWGDLDLRDARVYVQTIRYSSYAYVEHGNHLRDFGCPPGPVPEPPPPSSPPPSSSDPPISPPSPDPPPSPAPQKYKSPAVKECLLPTDMERGAGVVVRLTVAECLERGGDVLRR